MATFCLGTTYQIFLKFDIKLYESMLYCMHFQIHYSSTSCYPNTYIFFHTMQMYKIFIAFISGTTYQGFLKWVIKHQVSLLYCVRDFTFQHSSTSCVLVSMVFYSLKNTLCSQLCPLEIKLRMDRLSVYWYMSYYT